MSRTTTDECFLCVDDYRMGDASRYSGDEVRRLAGQAKAGLSNPHLYSYLMWKYGKHPLLMRGGRIYPVVAFEAPENQVTDVESVLLELTDVEPNESEYRPRSKEFRILLENTLKPGRLKDLPTYTMSRIVVSDQRLGIVCQRGTYFRALETCDSLEWEILLAAAIKLDYSSEDAFEEFDRQLPLRSELHRLVGDPVIDGRHRSAVASVSTLLVYIDDDTYYAWLSPRSEGGVTAYRNALWHVVPSFVFQPTSASFEGDWSVRRQIYREYLEELFGRAEPSTSLSYAAAVSDDECIVELKSMLDGGEASLYLSGLAVNLLNLRPEVCTVLLIRVSRWYRHHRTAAPPARFQLNQEFLSAPLDADHGFRRSRVPLMETDDAQLDVSDLGPATFIPPGAAAFWLGVGLVRDVLRRTDS